MKVCRFPPAVALLGLAAAALAGCATDSGSVQPSFYASMATASATVDAGAAASMISGYRGNNGLGAVEVDPELMRMAMDQARVMAAKDKLHVTVLRPPLIYGPRDRETLAFFTSVRNGVLPMTGHGKNTLSVVYVADCAAAIVRALTTAGAPSGRAYFVDDGAVYVWRDALADIESALGRRAFVRFGMPMGALKVAAAATQLWGKVANTAQMLTLDKVNELTQPHWVCSGAGARRDLGWEPRVQWPQGVQEAVKWYRAEGWL